MAWWHLWKRETRAQQHVADPADRLALQLATLGNGSPPKKGSRELLEAYAQLPWLHAVVRRRAESLASVEWVLYRRRVGARLSSRDFRGLRAQSDRRHRAIDALVEAGAVDPLLDHPFLRVLERPNPYMTGRALWEVTSKHHDLLGESFWALDRDKQGRVSEIWPVTPTWIMRMPDQGRDTWSINAPSFGRGGGILEVPDDDIVWIKQHDPLDPFRRRGVGTAGALGDELETDEYASAMAKTRFFNRATPETIVAINGVAEEQLKRFATDFENKHRGIERAGQTHFLSRDFKVQTLSHTLVESQYVELRKLLRDFTVQVFGTPPEILGVLENSNRSTIDAAEVLFARFSTVPMLERLRSELQAWLVPEYGDDLILDYVSPVPSDAEFEKSVIVALPGAFTLNEIRARAGEPPLDGDDGDRLYAAPGAVPTPDQVDEQVLPAGEVMGVLSAPDEEKVQ